MIKRLNRKFLLISAGCIFGVMLVIFVLISILNISSTNATLDDLTDSLSQGDGWFSDMPFHRPDRFGPEVHFSTRHFTVWFDREDDPFLVNTEHIHAVDAEEAVEYAEDALDKGDRRGWYSHYRYKIYSTPLGSVFTATQDRAGQLMKCFS